MVDIQEGRCSFAEVTATVENISFQRVNYKKNSTFAKLTHSTMIKQRLSYSFIFVLAVQLLGLAFMMLIRCAFSVINFPDSYILDWSLMLHALVKGVQFDAQVASYVAILPLAVLTILSFVKPADIKISVRVFSWYYGIVYTLVLATQVADIHYFQFFENHLNWNALEWFKFGGTTMGMLFGDSSNYAYLAGGLIIAAVFCMCLRSMRKRIDKHFAPNEPSRDAALSFRDVGWSLGMTLVAWGICFLGLRASLERYPLRVSFASFCDQAFYNRIPVNPWINIVETLKQAGKQYNAKILAEADEDEALAYVKQTLGIENEDVNFPLDRPVSGDSVSIRPNIVLILMESMSSQIQSLEHDGQPLTPYLNSLRDSSIYFSDFYSAGIHTNNGIVASLYGYSPNFAQAAMATPSDLYTGLPASLVANGYNTYAFVTSNPNYDNMMSFFYDNGIQTLYSMHDWPSDEQVNNFGISDGNLFKHGFQILNERNDTTPFFAMLLTVSNHGPFVFPAEYASRGDNEQDCTVAFADDAIRDFMTNARNTAWGRNTIFVLCGDHGWARGNRPYDMVLQYNHARAFITGEPIKDKYRQYDKPAGQIDLFPTIMGLTGLPYVNNTLGVDLLRQERRYIHFVSDTHLGCTDGKYLWCHNVSDGKDFLYLIASEDEKNGLVSALATNSIAANQAAADEMRRYAVSMMKVNNLAVQKKWTSGNGLR